MLRSLSMVLFPAAFQITLGFAAVTPTTAWAQVRVTPKASKGEIVQGPLWAEVPETYHHMGLPEWPLPTDLADWETSGRERTRETLMGLLGEMPPRPDPKHVKVLSREERDGYVLERFEFHNGVDMVVPGILLVPKGLKGPAPAIIGLHGHGGSKEMFCVEEDMPGRYGPSLASKGYVVAAIDGYFSGDRIGRGPSGSLDTPNKAGQQTSQFKLHLWFGRTLWGMMLRDEQCLIDYLETRPEVDPQRIGATGASMGCTRAWWLAAIDDRVRCIVGVVCFTRYTELIALGNLRYHGVYYFVPGMLKHFDTEAIYALVAPRPMLQLSGDEDGGAPLAGVETLERKLAQVYALHGKPENFRSVVYKHTGHEYLPEMRVEMESWFERHLPPRPGGVDGVVNSAQPSP